MNAFTSPFSAWSGPRDAKTVIIGEAWGFDEQMLRLPFVGTSGRELWRMLGEAFGSSPLHKNALDMHRYGNAWVRSRDEWLEEESLAFTNVFNLQPAGNKIEELCTDKHEAGKAYSLPFIARGQYLKEEFFPHLDRLKEELAFAPRNLLVALGNTACWATLDTSGIGAIRGTTTWSQKYSTKVLPSYHPAAVLRQWSWRPIVVADLLKAKRERNFPELRRPERLVLVNPSRDELRPAFDRVLDEASRSGLLSVDIETAGRMITCIGFAGSPNFAFVLPFVAGDKPGGHYWTSPEDELYAWQLCKDVLENCPTPKLGQNFLYDLQYLARFGIQPLDCLEDTMLLHHALFPELQKSLGFLGSIYTSEPAWKIMRKRKSDTEKRDE